MFVYYSLKVFVPLMVLAFTILVPVNATSSISDAEKDDVGFSDIDKFSISNVSEGSNRSDLSKLNFYLF
ncbi:hypothetical protein SUGI_0510070 [Cryptomeria japonica]|nr:hypothetical protein SUGI_0510070 [Cryptomeria japonica]